ncbi:hypothetical protein SAMN04487944_11710 [Gracilibacillus ureilyticus]|uniref:Uncharacterized protein n=1 Tax=Gracilibacillus ureilyticus TaxID=531814 RepID=A0A1H9UCF3_9BACI|nr:hypothetical protein [Gracilibacillus ureilyticus]SES07012.1 hypothetical protein SAMN04487944_11710 [Gracilibacillus ureilyticus]
MLKYIFNQLQFPILVINDLRSNMVLHALYRSKGAALKDIIELFGYLPFVQYAFEKYCEELNTDVDSYFSPLSLDEVVTTNEELEDDDKEKNAKINGEHY